MTLSAAVEGGLKVTPGYKDGTAASSGEAADYTQNTTALTFAGTAGEQHSFTVSTTEDTELEANETFTLALTASDAPERPSVPQLDPRSVPVVASDTATGTINDDDAPVATITGGDAVTEGTAASFTVSLTMPAPVGGLSIALTVSDAVVRRRR